VLLEIEDLHVEFPGDGAPVAALRGLDLAMGREKLALVGGSGSGKSSTGRAVLRVLPSAARLRARRLAFDGVDLLALPARRMREIRGRRIAMILQDARYALNPLMRVGAQLAEVVARAGGVPRRGAAALAVELLAQMRLREPERVATLYPHQLSGGMGQRVMIAMMLALGPDLLIADEPTSALDATVARDILRLVDALVRERGMGLLFVTHDLDLAAGFCDRVAVMAEGRIVETLPAAALDGARHPVTRRLLAARPRLPA
jgi:peptide/nickel transport system ATP-binding protein